MKYKVITGITLVLLVISILSTLSIFAPSAIAQGTTREIQGVPLIGQETSMSCWAACSEMILKYYGTYGPLVSQRQIAREAGYEDFYFDGLPWWEHLPFVDGWEGSLERLGKLDVYSEWVGLSFDEVINDINLDRPIIAAISVGFLEYHGVLIIGYIDNPGTDTDQVILHNPLPVGLGTKHQRLWATFQSQLTWSPRAIRTTPKVEKREISIQFIEAHSSGILRFITSSKATYPWWTKARRWNVAEKSWATIPGTPDEMKTEEIRTIDVDIDTNGAGNYRLILSATMLEQTTWNTSIEHVYTRAHVFADPPMVKSEVIGETVTVNINVSSINDLCSWQAGMMFDPNMLECTSYSEGEFLQRGGETYWIDPTPAWDNAKGIAYTHGCALMGPIPGVNGSGQLGYLTFEVKGIGVSDLHLTNVKFVNSDVEVMQHEVVDVYTVSLGNPEFSVETISNLTAISSPPDSLSSVLLNHTFSPENKTIAFDFVTPYDNFYIVTIPKTLLSCANLSDWTVEVDDQPVPFTPTENLTQTSLHFAYHNSSHKVKITGTIVFGETSPVGGIYIPANKLELLAPYIGLTILLVTCIVTIAYVKKRKRNTEINS